MFKRSVLESSLYARRAACVVLAFACAPALPAIVFAATSPGLVSPSDVPAFVIWSMIFYFYGLSFTLCLAVPAYLVASRFKLVKLWSALVAGAMVGAAVSAAIPSGMSQPYYWQAVREALPLYTALGASAAAVFFLVLIGAGRLLQINRKGVANEP